MGSKHALLIGVSRYGEGFLPIPSALLDVEALAGVLRDPELGDFPEAQVQVLPDPDSGTMAQAVEIFFANRDPDDLLLLYFSEHGWRENSRLLFCCQGTAKFMEGPQRGSVLQSTALKAEDVQRWMEASRSKHQVLILDCCYSAAFAEGMSAKGDGPIALEDTFGGRGRAVLTSSDAIETSSAPESGDGLSVYTRFLVEGIRTGAADRQQRGFVDAEDLHTYVSRRVAEAAPAMTPQFIPTREGHRIVVCKARRDPTVAYRQEVEKLAGERSGVISPAGRFLLDDLKRELALPQHATEAIEAEVLQPFRDYAEKISRYQQALEALAAALPEPGSLLSPVDQEELALLEKRFKLRGSDVEALHRRLGIRFGEPEAAITTIDADPPPTSPSSEPQEGPSAGGGEVSFQQITTTHGWLEREGNSWQVRKDVVEVQGYREELAPGVALTMLRIPAGSFLMGSPANEPERASNEGPQHEVRLEEFYLSQTPITQAEWRVVASWPKVELDLNPDPSNFKGSNRPVERVNWHEAMEFCRRLSDPTGRRYGLPSEAQWEYACRAGTTTPFHFGATLTAELANYDGTFLRFFGRYNGGPKGVNRKETTPVGTFPANPWGLHDVHGNVWEWCDDHWHDNYQGAPANGRSWLIPAAGSEEKRLLRGGSWGSLPRFCRSAYRFGIHPVSRYDGRGIDFGFRVCCLPPGSSS